MQLNPHVALNLVYLQIIKLVNKYTKAKPGTIFLFFMLFKTFQVSDIKAFHLFMAVAYNKTARQSQCLLHWNSQAVSMLIAKQQNIIYVFGFNHKKNVFFPPAARKCISGLII